MRESKKARKERLDKAIALLAGTYPEAKPALHFTNAFELLIATMLSAQCTDKQVNKVTAELFKNYGTPEALAALTPEELEPHIKGCGLFKTKAKNIVATCKILMEEHGGKVPEDRDLLTTLPGVGRKTANVVVSNAFGTPAIAVDTHVFRVSNRIGLAEAKDVLNTEKQLMENIPEEQWSDAHHWIIYHGRQVCAARNPKCEICTVKECCKDYLSRK
ncbi:MAG: endonuclease III [Clostridia bacterium]|nr:endonuclease III [Clostridia bacterium]MBR0026831.1 endonuclease III [Clostridia bacterium]